MYSPSPNFLFEKLLQMWSHTLDWNKFEISLLDIFIATLCSPDNTISSYLHGNSVNKSIAMVTGLIS